MPDYNVFVRIQLSWVTDLKTLPICLQPLSLFERTVEQCINKSQPQSACLISWLPVFSDKCEYTWDRKLWNSWRPSVQWMHHSSQVLTTYSQYIFSSVPQRCFQVTLNLYHHNDHLLLYLELKALSPCQYVIPTELEKHFTYSNLKSLSPLSQ